MQAGLITLIKNSDRGAFDALCRERYVSLVSYARLFLSGVDPLWAEDVVQDVLFGVWQNRRRLRDDEKELQAYLLRSVYNRCVNYLKRARRLQSFNNSYEDRMLAVLGDCWSPDRNPVIRSVFSADLRDLIAEAVSKLSPRCREVFTLSYLENYSNKEISERLGISLSTVENHMYLALKQLRASLANI
ncbi:MAG: RNA polymerase sigma-70 factor [Bacteroidales bacterium]|jgi:RNA polymerase sigma-70 factor (ECF subfamily)|nr:RNA polymerase sigma-70 factor [Bacteroidales bacterium]